MRVAQARLELGVSKGEYLAILEHLNSAFEAVDSPAVADLDTGSFGDAGQCSVGMAGVLGGVAKRAPARPPAGAVLAAAAVPSQEHQKQLDRAWPSRPDETGECFFGSAVPALSARRANLEI